MVSHNSQGQGHEHSENWWPNRMPNVYSVCLWCENRIFSSWYIANWIFYHVTTYFKVTAKHNIVAPNLWPITLKVNHNREFLVPMCMASWRKNPPRLFELWRSHHPNGSRCSASLRIWRKKMISIRNIYPMTLFGQPNIVLYKRKY